MVCWTMCPRCGVSSKPTAITPPGGVPSATASPVRASQRGRVRVVAARTTRAGPDCPPRTPGRPDSLRRPAIELPEFKAAVRDLQSRARALDPSVTPMPQTLGRLQAETYEGLRNALEELRVAEEDLHQ